MAVWFAAVCAFILLGACASEEQVCEEKLEKLSYLRNKTRADLFRQQQECRALQIEFNDIEIVGLCMETYRLMEEAARKTIADIDKRMDDPDMQRCLQLKSMRAKE